MNLPSIIVLLVVFALVGLAVRSNLKRKKSGGCGCGCAGCTKGCHGK